MSKPINDGGPAFPFMRERVDSDGSIEREWSDGMSLRDWFAAQAVKGGADVVCDCLQGEATDGPAQAHAESHARAAYIMADAMLRAREAK